MNVTINGSAHDLAAGASLGAAASRVGVGPDDPGVAAAVDGVVIPRADWDTLSLDDGARVEIVRAAAGG